jgi:predicted DCC family thiol-disulfide oxidoreductase YuxK
MTRAKERKFTMSHLHLSIVRVGAALAILLGLIFRLLASFHSGQFSGDWYCDLLLVAFSFFLLADIKTKLFSVLFFLFSGPFFGDYVTPIPLPWFFGLVLLGLAILPEDWSSHEAARISSLVQRGFCWLILALSLLSTVPALLEVIVAIDPSMESSFFRWGMVNCAVALAPVTPFMRWRPWGWLGLVGLHAVFLLVSIRSPFGFGIFIFDFFLLNESWIPSLGTAQSDKPVVFFDGTCVICSFFARALIALDSVGALRLAPQQGPTFSGLISSDMRENLPDSIIVWQTDGAVLCRSDAIIFIGKRLGGLPAVGAILFSFIPRVVRDFLYDFVARIRYRVFGRSSEVCGLLPPDVRARLLP